MGENMFRDRAVFLFVISAILLPLIFITSELMLIGMFIALFILSQVILIYMFYKEKTTGLEHWYAFWTGILSLVFMLIIILFGKSVWTEFLGLLLFLVYFVGVVIFLFRRYIASFFRKPKKKRPEEDYEEFRKKDELKELADFFEPEAREEVRIVDIEEPKIDKIIVEEAEEEPWEEPRKEPEEELEEWMDEIPKSVIFDYAAEPEKKPKAIPKIKEIKKAPKIDFEKVKKDLDKIDDGVKTISEKIKLISEKAILEGAEKKVQELKKEEEKKKPKPKPKKSRMKVYASKTGTRYHYDKNCLGLKRVSKKNLVTYSNPVEARKKKLKACDICK